MGSSSKTFGKLTILLLLLLAISFFAVPVQAKYGGGTGAPNDPYQIRDANHMQGIGADSNDWDKCFKLMADIDLSVYTGTSFNIIGNFTGVFDGNDHTISNFTYISTGTNYIGFFGCVDDPNAAIKDLGFIAPNVDAGTGYYVGSLVGDLYEGSIINCYAEGGSVLGGWYVGGLLGENYNGTITNCYAKVSVEGERYVGGLVGKNYRATITNCYSTGSVIGDYTGVGGLVGHNYDGTITNCYSEGSVSGFDYVGGLVGYNSGTVTNCYATGSVVGIKVVGGLLGYNHEKAITYCYSVGGVSGQYDVGGLVGWNGGGEITYCYWDIETSGQDTSDGGTGKTTTEMQAASTFLEWSSCNDEGIWTIDEGLDYPHLWWEDMPGEPIPNAYGGGSGVPNDPYLIYTSEQLNMIGLIGCDWNNHFKLMADIDLAGFTVTSFNIIGNFTGVFDGNDHTISNFTYISTGTDYIGLFRRVSGENAEIKNLGLIDPNVHVGAGDWIGSLAGILGPYGTINNCYVKGGSVSGRLSVGGLVGSTSGDYQPYYPTVISNCYANTNVAGHEIVGALVGTLTNWVEAINCYADGDVSGDGYVGGLVGQNFVGTITNCYATGSVTGTDGRAGGLVGGADGPGRVLKSYAKGRVSGDSLVGGLVGAMSGGIMTGGPQVINCYATGSVSGYESVGGLVGDNASSSPFGYDTIINCYATGKVVGEGGNCGGLIGSGVVSDVSNSFWDVNTSGWDYSEGGVGKTTVEMQTESTFTDAGWDFSTPVWKMNCEGMNYPKLSWWQPVLGDFGCPDGVNFFDFSFFAAQWAEDNCGASNDCDGRDLDQLGSVDIKDLRIFVDKWLRGF